MRKTGLLFATMLLMVVPLSAQDRMDSDRKVEGGGVLAEGWMARTDRGESFDQLKFTDDHGTLDISVGPGFVAYRDEYMASGDYTVSATVEQIGSQDHPHGTGLIVGGADILGPDQVYTYFLVRGNGQYIIKTRTGDTTAEVMPWTEHDAIHPAEMDKMTNEMSIQVMGSDMIFSVNGHEVHRAATADLYHDGHYGIRLNHNLDMRISDLKVMH